MTLPKHAFFRGHIVPYSDARIGVLSHGLNYGTAAFGGLRGYWSEDEKELFVFRPLDHFRRFLQSARLLLMDLPYAPEDLAKSLRQLLLAEGLQKDCYIRPLCYYSDEMIGVRLHDLHPEVSMVAVPYGNYLSRDEGLHVGVSSWRRVDDNVIPARGKIAGSYVNSALAKTEAIKNGFDEALLLNEDGHLCEASAANVFVIRDGVVLTPPVSDNILEGITRRTIMTLLADELGHKVVERSIDRTELYVAEEVFLVGTGVQIGAIGRIDHRPVGNGKIGPITAAVKDLFFQVVRGKVPKYRHFCSPVYQEGR
jgi:branched-chain amino acid aminotransferase